MSATALTARGAVRARPRSAIAALALALAASAVALPSRAKAPPARPNVVIILADDLGYGDTGAYGATLVRTPNIDRLAREGRRYTDAYSPASVCSPSRYSLLAGRYAWRTWMKSGAVWATDPLVIEPDRFTLPDLFASRGYRTAIVGKWHLGFGAPGQPGWDDVAGPDFNRDVAPGPLEIGFGYAWVFPQTGQRPHFIIENHRVLGLDPADPIQLAPVLDIFRKPYLERPRLGTAENVTMKGGRATLYTHAQLSDMLTARAVRYIREQDGKQPFFLYVAHRNPHAPYTTAPRFAGTSVIGPYGDMIDELDASVGEVLRALDERDFSANTLVVFASDNGGIANYHKHVDAAVIHGHRINGPLRGQKTDAYEGGVRVPFIARWPGHVPAATESSALIALTDMLATFADFFHAPLPVNAGEDSYSFLDDLLHRPADQARRTALVNDAFSGVFAIREGDWKLILAQTGGGIGEMDVAPDPSRAAGQLYDLRHDVGETNNLHAKEPARVAHLTALLARYRESRRSTPEKR
jgi:arylsulfatase A-like enzyme